MKNYHLRFIIIGLLSLSLVSGSLFVSLAESGAEVSPVVSEPPEEPSPEVSPIAEETPTTAPDASTTATPVATATPTTGTVATSTPTTEVKNTPTKAPTSKPTATQAVVVPPDEENNYNVKETDRAGSVTRTPFIEIDGKEDAVWANCAPNAIENVVWGTDGAKATFQVAWDQKHIYYLIKVTDSTEDITSGLLTRTDSVEIYLDETGLKPEIYGNGSQHYIISRNGSISYGSGADDSLITYAVSRTSDGYMVEASVSLVTAFAQKGATIGTDVRINDSFGTELRDYIVQWSDTSMNTHKNLSKVGTITLK